MNTWTPEAKQLTPRGTPGTMAGGAAKAILHVTVSPSGGNYFDAMDRVLTSHKSEPHYLYDPVTDELGQYFPLNVSARALETGSGAVSCNKAGSHVIQIEVVAWPGTEDGRFLYGGETTKGGFTSLWKPGPNFRAMMRDIRAAGVPDVFPMGALPDPRIGARRGNYDQYRNTPGWWAHAHVPGQNHWDPGLIDQAAFFAAAYTGSTTPTITSQAGTAAVPPQGELTMAQIDDILTSLAKIEARLPSNLPQATDRLDKGVELLQARVGAALTSRSSWTYDAMRTAVIPLLQTLAEADVKDAAKLDTIIKALGALGDPKDA